MPFNSNETEWNKTDTKPAQTKLDAGWSADEKPPASIFNWFFNNAASAIKDLLANAIHKDQKGANNGVATLDVNGDVPAAQLPAATTAAQGAVVLSTSTSDTSVTKAATPSAVKSAYDLANGKAPTTAVTQAANGLMIAADKTKLDGVATGANNYVHPTNHPPSIITQDSSNRFTTDAEKTTWNGKAPTTAVTTAANGLMIAADKTKLDGIATGAEVNQSTFSNVLVGATTIAADSKTDTLEIASGNAVTLTPDATNDKLTIAVNDATTTVSGAMSGADKTKLDGIAAGAEVNQNGFSNVLVGATTIAADSKTDTLEIASGNAVTLTPDATNDKLTIAVNDATTTVSGAMNGADKTKLNGIATGAEVNQNAFSNVLVGSTTLSAELKTDTLTIAAGNAVTLTPDATNDKLTIAVNDATTTISGAMSGADKTKLNGIGNGSTTVAGLLQLVDSTTSTDAAKAATANAAKMAYDRAVSAETNAKNASLPLTGGTLTGALSNTGQTHVEVELATTVSIPSKAWTNLGDVTATVNVGGGWQSAKNFVAPTNGVYMAWAQCFFDTTTPDGILIQIGATVGPNTHRMAAKMRNGIYDGTLAGSIIMDLNAGDTMSIQVYQGDTVARPVTSSFVKIIKLT